MNTGITIQGFLLFFAGISFLATFYWLMAFIYSKRRNYFILIAITAVGTVYFLNAFGIIFHLRKAELIFFALVVLALCGLASELNRFSKNLPPFVFFVFVTGMAFTVIFQLLSPLFLPWQKAIAISHFLTIAGGIVVSSLFLYLWIRKGKQTARFSFFVYLPHITGYTIFAFSQMNILPPELKVAGPIGACIFLLLISYGMVTYVITLRRKREEEHLEKQVLVQQQNILLKQKIEERTIQLEAERKRSEELLIRASQKQMAELELQSLRAQLNPHFMFNSLNAIQELILKEDFENSYTYLVRFAKLLRMLLENSEKPFISLQKEIDFLELYLSLERLRLSDLQFSITADPFLDKEETLIPNMILQPYIENALWHGLSHKPADRQLEINIQEQNGTIIYNVKDNGVGRKTAAELKSLFRKGHRSKGMEILTKRFKLLSDEFGFDIKTQVSDVMVNGKVAGTKVSIMVPGPLTQTSKNELYDTYNYH